MIFYSERHIKTMTEIIFFLCILSDVTCDIIYVWLETLPRDIKVSLFFHSKSFCQFIFTVATLSSYLRCAKLLSLFVCTLLYEKICFWPQKCIFSLYSALNYEGLFSKTTRRNRTQFSVHFFNIRLERFWSRHNSGPNFATFHKHHDF